MIIDIPPRRAGIPLSKFHERWVHFTYAGLVVSGILWLVFHYFLVIHGPSSVEEHPLQAWWLKLHGAMAMGFLIVLGALLPIHMRRNWLTRMNIASAVPLTLLIVIMIITGYGLYYAGSEALRPWISLIHWAAGLVSVPALIIHVMVGKKSREASWDHLVERRIRYRREEALKGKEDEKAA